MSGDGLEHVYLEGAGCLKKYERGELLQWEASIFERHNGITNWSYHSDLVTRLGKFYSESEVFEWLTSPHLQLSGETAKHAIECGRKKEVIAIVERLEADAYIGDLQRHADAVQRKTIDMIAAGLSAPKNEFRSLAIELAMLIEEAGDKEYAKLIRKTIRKKTGLVFQ